MATVTQVVNAAGFEFMGDEQSLANQLIVSVGNVSEVPRVVDLFPGKTIAPVPVPVYRIGAYCFEHSGSISGNAGLLLVDKYSTVSVALISNATLAIRVVGKPIVIMDCSTFMQQDIKQMQEKLEIRRKESEASFQQLMKKYKPAQRP